MPSWSPPPTRALFWTRKDVTFLKGIIEKLALYRPAGESFLARLGAGDLNPLQMLQEMADECREWDVTGDIWHGALTCYLASCENAWSLRCEMGGGETEGVGDVVDFLARCDFVSIRDLFKLEMPKVIGMNMTYDMPMYISESRGTETGRILTDLAKRLANACSDEIYHILREHYRTHGVGILGHYRAFKLGSAGELKPIAQTDPARFTDLVGCEEQKAELLKNTRAFLAGKDANNVLLYGDSGTGKSTCIKALINECWQDGLRLIEAYKYQMPLLPDVIAAVKNRGYHFILYIDDLSFEDFEGEYKFLKSVIEGDVEGKPKNLLVYATSNRRHLVKETWSDRGDMTHHDDIHHSDTLEEKLSLAGRFGLSINFSVPRRGEYHEIVATLARKAGIVMDEKELFRGADAWEIRHGGVSGRVAQQYINYLACGDTRGEKEPTC